MTTAAKPSCDDAGATLDVADGIARVMGDRVLYARILTRFHDDYRDGAAPLRAAVAGAELRLSKRIAHTLKAAAASRHLSAAGRPDGAGATGAAAA